MKKFWFLLISLILLPLGIKAENFYAGVRSENVSDGAFFEGGNTIYITSFEYHLNNDKYGSDPMYCIDGGVATPWAINNLVDLDTSNYSIGKYLIPIYAAADAIGASRTTASDASRIIIALYSPKISGVTYHPYLNVSSNQFLNMLKNAGYTLAGLDKLYSDTTTISKKSPNYSQLQKVFCTGVKAYGDTSSNLYKGCSEIDTPSVIGNNSNGKLTVNMYEDSTKTRRNPSSDRIFSQYVGAKVGISPSDAKIKITGCFVNNSNYECSISSDYLNKKISNNAVIEVLVQSKNNNLNTDATQVNVYINYSFDGGTSYSLKQGTCQGSGCASLDGKRSEYDRYTQRMIVVTSQPGNSDGTAVLGVNVPKACQHVDNNYKVGNKTVSVKEYMEYGCCSDIDVKDLTNPDDLNYYKDTCMDDDIVSFSNVCGSSLGCLERDGDYKNNKYVGYSKSAIFQKSLKNIMRSVNNLENGAYKTNDLSNMYNEKQISNNLDKNYTSKLSPNNKYCMLYTSEDLKINFPGTTETVSGRSFVFEELTNTECKTNPNASSKNCFRQPYVNGTLSMAFHTNVDRWLNDYKAAVNAVTEANKKLQNASSASDKEAAQANVDIAKQKVSTLENYKKECETYSNLRSNNWDYNLEPDLTFYYDQKVYAKDESSPTITTTVNMVPSYKAVKYWPNVTGNTELSGSCSGGTATYNGFTYSTNKDCNYTAKRTVYYRPEKITYSLISTGELKTIEYEHEENINENGILIGYVYNTSISIEQGEYQTRFEINNVGHNKDQSNIQNSYNKYKEEHKDASGHLYSKCIYCNKSSKTIRLCDTCPPSDAAIIYRSIATDNVTPQDRANTNWSDIKGKVAEALIEASDGSKIISNVGENYLALADNLAVNNTNSDTSDDKTIALNGSDLADLYNDSTKEYLEYEITLTTKDMQIIKKNNARSSFSYATFNLCKNGKKVGKDENTDYCFVCNSSGKECESSFVDSFSDDSALLANTRSNKWKYFYYDATDQINPGKFISGSMKDYQSNDVFKKLFPDGKYPDPELVDAYLYVNKNWP